MSDQKTKTALELLDDRYFATPEARALLVEAEANLRVGMMIHEARTRAGLTQQELADRVATKKSAISRLEDADYKGHSLAMLTRIANALDMDVRLELVPRAVRKTRQSTREPSAQASVVREDEAPYKKRKKSAS